MYGEKDFYYGTGRRKSSVARVRLYKGTGNFVVNGRELDSYFGLKTLKVLVKKPLDITGSVGRFDVICNVRGGGISGQAGAIRHGISRALLMCDEKFRSTLKREKFLTRDSRMKERKKYGLKKARKAPQFSKR